MTVPRIAIALLALGAAVAALTRLPLAWDGSYIALNVLWGQEPFMPHGRWVNLPLQSPVLLASRWISDTGVLAVIFSAAYAILPAVALMASWWVVRDRAPRSLVWPALGIGLLTLPGQAFFVSEAVLSTQLIWPLVLAVSVGAVRQHAVLLAVLAVALAFAHPIAVALLGLVVVLWAVPRQRGYGRSPRRLVWVVVGLGAVLLLGLRYLAGADSYEAEQVSVDTFLAQAQTLDAGRLGAIALVYLAAMAIVARHVIPPSLVSAVDGVVVAAVLGAAVLLIAWGLDPLAWVYGLEYRGLVLFVCGLLYAAAFIDARFPGSTFDRGVTSRGVRATLLTATATWAIVVTSQGLHWQATLRDFNAYLERSETACVPAAAIRGIERSPLNHWSVTTLSLLEGGKEPGRLVLVGDGCSQRLADGFPIAGVEERPWESRWFVTQPLRSMIALQRADTAR